MEKLSLLYLTSCSNAQFSIVPLLQCSVPRLVGADRTLAQAVGFLVLVVSYDDPLYQRVPDHIMSLKTEDRDPLNLFQDLGGLFKTAGF